MQKLLLFAVLLSQGGFPGILALNACGRPIVQSRIVGGVDSMTGEWPWQVTLQNKGNHMCGGTLISDSWVLLAAHCFENALSPSEYTVYLGVNQLSVLNGTNVVVRGVQQIIVHPDFTEEGSSGDIALIELNKPVTFSTYVLPVCLPSQSLQLPEDTICWTTGWGDIKEGVILPPPQTLQKVPVALISNVNCEAMYRSTFGYGPNFHLIEKDMICAGYKDGKKDACQGDSGGPLACNVNGVWLQLGITSWGFGCARPKRPGVYTRVQYYQSWLQQNVPSVPYSRGGVPTNTNSLSPRLNGTQIVNLTLDDSPRVEALVASGAFHQSLSGANIILLLLALISLA